MSTSGKSGKDDEVFGRLVAFLVVIAIIGGIITAIAQALRELARAIGKLFETIGKVFLLYLGAWIAALIVLPVVDLMVVTARAWRRKSRRRNSVVLSNFPNHGFLQDSRYLDSLFWKMIELYIGRRTTALREKKGHASEDQGKKLDRMIEDQHYLKTLLLEDEQAFRTWKHDHMYAVVSDEKNRHILTEAYGRVWRFCREDYARGRQDGAASPFTALVVSKIDLEPNPDPWFITKMGVFVLSFGRLSRKEDEQNTLTSVGSEQARLRQVFSDETRFRQFLNLYLFDIMDQVGPFPLNISRMQHEVSTRSPSSMT
jgi:hypothetical protein